MKTFRKAKGDYTSGYHAFHIVFRDELEDRRQEPLTLLGQIVAIRDRFVEFEDVARLMGSWDIARVVSVADQAMKRRKRSLECKVFEAAPADGGEWAGGDLKAEYEKLKRGA